jgi:hypothetical protein
MLNLLPAAAKKNSKFNLKNLKVYGLLSDFTTFHFYTYDPKTRTFSNDGTMWVGPKRENVYTDMIEGLLHLVTLGSYLTVFPSSQQQNFWNFVDGVCCLVRGHHGNKPCQR